MASDIKFNHDCKAINYDHKCDATIWSKPCNYKTFKVQATVG
jgi:hypothetical protein